MNDLGLRDCQRCGKAFCPEENAAVEPGPVLLPWGEKQSTLVGGMNLTYCPLSEETFQKIVDAYSGPGCRYHPEPFDLHATWPDGEDTYYDCCWAFREDMPGCQVGPHLAADPEG